MRALANFKRNSINADAKYTSDLLPYVSFRSVFFFLNSSSLFILLLLLLLLLPLLSYSVCNSHMWDFRGSCILDAIGTSIVVVVFCLSFTCFRNRIRVYRNTERHEKKQQKIPSANTKHTKWYEFLYVRKPYASLYIKMYGFIARKSFYKIDNTLSTCDWLVVYG